MKNQLLLAIVAITLVGFLPAHALKCMAGCLSCTNPFTCDNCTPGLNCCYPTCSTCSNSTICADCIDGYSLSSKNNVCQLDNACTSDQACAECSGKKCKTCVSGFTLSSLTSSCVACPSKC